MGSCFTFVGKGIGWRCLLTLELCRGLCFMGLCHISCLSQIQTFHRLGPKPWSHPCFLSFSHSLFNPAGYFVGFAFRIYPESTLLLPPRLKPASPVTWNTAGASSLPSLLPLLAATLPLSGNFQHSSQREAVLKSQITFSSPSSAQDLSMASHFSQRKLTSPSCGPTPPRPPGPGPAASGTGCCPAPVAAASVCPSTTHPCCGSSPCLGCSSLRRDGVHSCTSSSFCAQL